MLLPTKTKDKPYQAAQHDERYSQRQAPQRSFRKTTVRSRIPRVRSSDLFGQRQLVEEPDRATRAPVERTAEMPEMCVAGSHGIEVIVHSSCVSISIHQYPIFTIVRTCPLPPAHKRTDSGKSDPSGNPRTHSPRYALPCDGLYMA